MKQLTVLMWKHLMVRKRRYFQTFFEFIIPIIFVILLFLFKDKIQPMPRSGLRFQNEIRRTDELTLKNLPSPSRVLYTPDTEFTNNLMDEVGTKLGLKRFKNDSDRASHQKGLYPFSNISEISDIVLNLYNDEAVVDLTGHEETTDRLSYTILMKSNYYTNSYEPMDGVLKPHSQFGADYNIFMRLQWAIDTSFIKLLTAHDVTQKLSVQEFPAIARPNADTVPNICAFMTYLCWISLTLMFIFLMSRLLEERASGIQEMVKMVGVSTNLLGISHFLNVLPIALVYSIGSTLLLKSTSNPLIPHSDGFVIFIVLFLHFVTIAALAFPCSYITQGSQYSTTLSVFVYVVTYLPAANIQKLLQHYPRLTVLSGILPHMPMMWAWQEIAAKEAYGQGLGFSDIMTSHMDLTGPVALGILFMIIQATIFFLVAWYLAHVRPGMYGQAMPFNFLCQPSYWNKNEVKPTTPHEEAIPISREAKYFEEPPKNMETGIKIENVTKIFPKHKALSNVSLDVFKGEITVLLGHNGAGKTTLMSIITGMMSASEGRILVNGKDVSKANNQVRQELGLCPQHNLFFSDLTVIEHAIFFTLLKGYTYKEAREKSYELLKRLGIQDKANVHSSALSGGMKRRLQLACSLAGGASVLVLDEPTSGLDVETRRELWDLLLSLRGDRTVLLTTHFMEEADALGDRVAALHQGHVRCHATPMYLKKAIGTGYRLTFTTTSTPRDEAVTAAVTSHVPEATLKEKTINGLSYSLPATASADFPELFTSIENRKSELKIETIGVGVSTLEEVFLKLCSDTDTSFTEDEVDRAAVSQATEPTQKVTGALLYWRQFCVLLKRQAKYVWDKKMYFLLLQVLIPALLIISFTRSTNNAAEEKVYTGKLSMDLDIYDAMGTRRVLYDVTDDAVNLRAVRGTWPKVEFIDTRNITTAVLRAGEADATEYNKYLVGIELSDTNAKALFTTTVRHAAPVALNLLSNALATRYLARADGKTFHTYFHPLQSNEAFIALSKPLVEPKAIVNIIIYGYFILFIVLATNINNVALTCNERVSGARHIHMMSGCPASLHWAATCFFHMFLCSAFLITTVAISAALLERDHTIDSPSVIMTMVFVLFLGSMAFFAMIYLVGCYLEERGSSLVLVGALIIFGIITTSIEVFSKILKDGDSTSAWVYLAKLAGYTMPPHATAMAFLKTMYVARLNAICDLNVDRCPMLLVQMPGFDVEKCCNKEPLCYTCIDEYGAGEHLIFLAVQFVFYMALVLLSQNGAFNGLGDKIFNTKYRNHQSRKVEMADEIVRAETIYIEKKIALPKKQIVESDLAMLASNLHKNYFSIFGKSCNAVKGVSFSVKKGECFGLLGVNGAGKSTTFKMLTAEQCPTKGNIYANGHFWSERQPYLRSLGYCPQFFGLDDFQTGRENLELLLTLRGLDAEHVNKEMKSWIQVVGLEKYSDSKVRDYSGGCKRRLAAAAALSSGAPLTLLDEPTAGVDVSARRRVWSALQRGLRHGRAVIITSHSMDEMEALCSRIGILSGGVVRALGTPSELRAHYAQGHAVLIKVSQNRAAASVSSDELDSAKVDIQQLKTALDSKFNCTLKDEHKTMLHYHINESMRYSDLFTILESLKASYPSLVEDYSVTETTLEEVFLSIAKEQHMREEQDRQEQLQRRRRRRGQENHVV